MYGRIGCLAAGVALTALTLLGCGQEQAPTAPRRQRRSSHHRRPSISGSARARSRSWSRCKLTRTRGRAE